MKDLIVFINEGLGINPKPIHTFANDGSFVNKNMFDAVMADLKNTLEPAVLSDHEDEYVYINNSHPYYNDLYNKYCTGDIENGTQTLGIGAGNMGWKRFKTEKPKCPVYYIYQGVDMNKTNSIMIADRHLFPVLRG